MSPSAELRVTGQRGRRAAEADIRGLPLDTSRRVLYVGSFSKVMLPTLRLGFPVAPRPLNAAFRKAKYLADWHTPSW